MDHFETKNRTGLMITYFDLIGFAFRSRKAPLRPQAIWLRWSDEASLPQKGKDNEEGGFEVGMYKLQDQGAIGVEALQAFRIGVHYPMPNIVIWEGALTK